MSLYDPVLIGNLKKSQADSRILIEQTLRRNMKRYHINDLIE